MKRMCKFSENDIISFYIFLEVLILFCLTLFTVGIIGKNTAGIIIFFIVLCVSIFNLIKNTEIEIRK